MGRYFTLKRLKSLGIPEDGVTEYEKEVVLYIDSQMDVQREKKSKREARKAPRARKR